MPYSLGWMARRVVFGVHPEFPSHWPIALRHLSLSLDDLRFFSSCICLPDLLLIMDFSQFNGAEQAHMTKVIEKKQMQDFMRLYSGLVERCFNTCVNDFTSKALTGNETTCVQNCTDKFLKHSERVGARFAEHNAEQMQQGGQ